MGGQAMDGVLSASQKCIIKTLWGATCKLTTGNCQEVREFPIKSWSSNPGGAKQLHAFLEHNYEGVPPRAKEDIIHLLWDVLRQLGQ
eukprot:9156091-Pyramimonas_sp.AAC.1